MFASASPPAVASSSHRRRQQKTTVGLRLPDCTVETIFFNIIGAPHTWGGGGIRKGDIIVAVDEPIAATRCKPGSAKGCTKTGARCVTHDLWEELGQQIHVFLSSVSLADVVDRKVLGRARPFNDVDRPVGSADGAAEIAAE